MHIHGRNGVLLGALVAALALVVPTSAFAAHDLGIYKVEKQIDLESDDLTATVSCNSGDYAVDGMWRLDHADQDDDDLFKTALGRSVDVLEAYPITQAKYTFLFEKNAIGRAQAKIWVVCLKGKTESASGHQHPITMTSYDSTGDHAVIDTANWYGETFSTSSAASNKKCGTNQFVAAPGFKIDWTNKATTGDPTPYMGRLATDWMAGLQTWTWRMNLKGSNATAVTYYWACVDRKVTPTSGEKHKLIYKLDAAQSDSIPASSIKTVRYSCKSSYKAVVAGFDFFGSLSGAPIADQNPDFGSTAPELWFLGMDPQPKSRDFKFLNGDSAGHNVSTRATCLNYRTT